VLQGITNRGLTIQPNLDRIDPVKSAASALATRYRSDTNNDVRWTVRKYAQTMAATAWVVAGWVPGWHTVQRPPTQRQLLPTQITHSISSSHLQLKSLYSHVFVYKGWGVIQHWLYAGLHLSCMSALPPLMSLLGVHALPVVNALTCSLKSTARSGAVQILMIKIEFNPAIDSNLIYQDRIQFEFSTRIISNLNHKVLHSTHTFIQNGMDHTCIYSPATERHHTLAGTHFPSCWGRRLSWPEWLVTDHGGLPAHRWSPIPVLTGPGIEYH